MIPLARSSDCWQQIGVAGDRTCPELSDWVHCRNCPVFAEIARGFFDRPAPQGYRDTCGEDLARTEPLRDPGTLSILLFRMGPEWLALPVTALAEVTTPRPTRRIPHRTSGLLLGLTNIRGQIHLCVNLHGCLAVPPQPHPERRRHVVIGSPGNRWVFDADEVHGVESVPLSDLGKIPGTHANPAHALSRAVIHWQQQHVGLLDEQRLLDRFREIGS